MEIFTIPLPDEPPGEAEIIYRPLLGLSFIGNRAMVELCQRYARGEPPEALQAEQPEAAAFLEQLGFWQPDPPPPPEPVFQPTTAVLMLTNRCQLRCVYCYAAAGEAAPLGLSFESGRAVIDFIHDAAQQAGLTDYEVYFHGGGEPTYHWDVLRRLAGHARSRPLPARLTLTSNAMWSAAQLDWIVTHMDGVGISMDGAPATQNRQRPVKSGRHSSPVVLRNLAELDRRGFPFGVRITALPPFDSLAEDVRFICESTGAQLIQVEPAYNAQRGSLAQPEAASAARFVEAFIEGYEIARAHQRQLYYSGARPDTLTNRFCTSPYSTIIVTPDDRIVACYEVVSPQHALAGISTVGRVEDGRVALDAGARQALFDLLERRLAACRECFCAWSCAGDCYTRAFLDGAESGSRSVRCEVNRAITRHILLSNIEAGNGAWRAPRGRVRQVVQSVAVAAVL